MSNLQKPFSKRQLEKRVEQAEAELESILRELHRISDAGAARIFERIGEIAREHTSDPVEQDRLCDELDDLFRHDLYLKHMDTTERLHAANDRVRVAKRDLERFNRTLAIAEAPPVASLPQMSLPKAGDAVPLKSKSSQSLFCLC